MLLPLFVEFSARSLFCFTVLCVFSSFEIISLPLFNVAPIVYGGLLVLGSCFVLRYFVYFLVLKSSRWHCLMFLLLFVGFTSVRSLFCFAVLCVFSSFAINSLCQRESCLLYFCSILNVVSLLSFFDSSMRCQYVIVAFPGHTY